MAQCKVRYRSNKEVNMIEENIDLEEETDKGEIIIKMFEKIDIFNSKVS